MDTKDWTPPLWVDDDNLEEEVDKALDETERLSGEMGIPVIDQIKQLKWFADVFDEIGTDTARKAARQIRGRVQRLAEKDGKR